MPPTSAYIHIPFCRRRCFYCDFPIAVAGDRARGETSSRIQTYVETLCREIAATPVLGAALTTVFCGGGTPSLLSVAQVEQVLKALQQRFGIATDAEISMEMDPGTFTRVTLQALQALGVNRVSLGVQSFHDEELAACGRTHRLKDVEQAIDDLHTVGLSSWSLDLISGLPHQTMAAWEANLARAIAAKPAHVSIYDLTVESGTVFDRRYIAGQSPLPTDEMTAQMYRAAQARLTQAGYDHYEISNYAKSGYQCQHNRTYWENRPYYAFGMGAASYTNQQRFHRPRTTHEYEQWVATYCQADGKLDCEPTPQAEQWLDRLMMGLRLAEGIPIEALTAEFGAERVARLRQILAPYRQKDWVRFEAAEVEVQPAAIALEPPSPQLHVPHGKPFQPSAPGLPAPAVRLTDPEGFLFSNVVLVSLFETFSDP